MHQRASSQEQLENPGAALTKAYLCTLTGGLLASDTEWANGVKPQEDHAYVSRNK